MAKKFKKGDKVVDTRQVTLDGSLDDGNLNVYIVVSSDKISVQATHYGDHLYQFAPGDIILLSGIDAFRERLQVVANGHRDQVTKDLLEAKAIIQNACRMFGTDNLCLADVNYGLATDIMDLVSPSGWSSSSIGC